MNQQARPPQLDLDAARSFLRKRAPDALAQLEAQEKEELAVKLGPAPMTIEQWRHAAETVAKSLEHAITLCDRAIESDRKLLLIAGRWQLAAEIVGVIGPASIFTVLKSDWPHFAQYTAAFFTLLAAILAVVARYAAQSPARGLPLTEHFRELADCKGRALALSRQVELNLQRDDVGQDEQDLLAQSVEVCSRIDAAVL